MSSPTAPVVVVGGGLAGIAAALRLADAGRPVTLIEKRPRLGGRAFSFSRGELSIDNGQHVFLRCCTAYQWLLRRLDAEHDIVLQHHLDIPVLATDGRRASISRRPGLPAPTHVTAALATYRLLGLADRARIARGALALRLLDPSDRRLDTRTLGEFLRAHGQNDATIDAMWGIVATATLNLAPDEASLALAAKVFRTGLLDHAPAADIGYAAVPLGRIHHDAAEKALADAGVQLLLDCAVRAVEPGSHVLLDGPDGSRRLDAATTVLATPPADAFAVLPALAASAAAPARDLRTSPIVNVHVIYDRAVTDLPFAAAVGSPVQWFFDRTDSSGLATQRPGAQYLAVTISAAADIIDRPTREVVALVVPELARLLPRARSAEVLDTFVTRERDATFRQSPGTWALRPRPDAGPDGVLLAGAWTDTGWPDTMESAVRSGIAAAESALGVPAPSSLSASEFAS